MGDKTKQTIIRTLDAFSRYIEFSGKMVVVAVSGGADSVALLRLLHLLAPKYEYVLHVVTVNHLIRSEDESTGDAIFVRELCGNLVPAVPCTVVTLAPGEVARTAQARDRGVEDAARFLRYRILDETAERLDAVCVMTGHTLNDRSETTLMRFLQGSSGGSLVGITPHRGRYLRPLLAVSHQELLAWLNVNSFSWREDATNADDSYLRNRIRLRLVPVLDRYFPGWINGIRSGAEKALLDEDLCQSLIRLEWKWAGNRIACPVDSYREMHPAVRLRFLRKGLSLLGVGHRVPGRFLLRIASASPRERLCLSGSGLQFIVGSDSVFFGPDIVQNGKTGYLVYILSSGVYRLPFGELTVTGDRDSVFLDDRLGPFTLPLIVRSRTGGDSIRTADGKRKTLKKLMNDWSISEPDRNLVPLVEQDGEIRAVYGSRLGYPDWYVHT